MADFKNHVDDDGIRLAPKPMDKGDCNVLPPVRQEFIITPGLSLDDAENVDDYDDYQPRRQDSPSRNKRRRRAKNMIAGAIMLALSLFVLLEYLLPLAGVWLESLPFKYVPVEYGAVINIIKAFRFTAQNGWSGAEVRLLWQHSVPDLMLMIGILCVLINMIKSVFGLFAAVRPQKYAFGAALYLLIVLIILVMSVVGAETIGIEKVDFVNDVIRSYKTSELFALTIVAAGYFIASSVVALINADKYGYLK